MDGVGDESTAADALERNWSADGKRTASRRKHPPSRWKTPLSCTMMRSLMDWTTIDRPTERLHAFISGFHATYYVHAGIECGLFEELVSPASPHELAEQLDLHEPYVKGFCEVGGRWDIIVPVGEVDRDPDTGRFGVDQRFRLRDEFVEPLADSSSVRYMGDVFRFVAKFNGEDYLEYPTYFRTGTVRRYTDRGAAFSETIEGSSRGLHVVFVEKLVPAVTTAFEERLVRGGRVLDVGCGAGHLDCYLADAYPDVEVVGVDVDADALERARENVREYGVEDRVTVVEADASEVTADELGTFDAAVSFLAVHEIPQTVRPAVFESVGELLSDDACFVVFDEVYPDTPEEFPEEPYANGVESQWSELVWGNVIPTDVEHRTLFERAGFSENVREPFAGRFVVAEATRQ